MEEKMYNEMLQYVLSQVGSRDVEYWVSQMFECRAPLYAVNGTLDDRIYELCQEFCEDNEIEDYDIEPDDVIKDIWNIV